MKYPLVMHAGQAEQMRRELSIIVPGHPQPKGSSKYVGHTDEGKPLVVSDNKKLKSWEAAVQVIAQNAWARANHGGPIEGPCVVRAAFFLDPATRSKEERQTGMAIRPPDIDKLMRGVLDPLKKARILKDDAIVVCAIGIKFAGGRLSSWLMLSEIALFSQSPPITEIEHKLMRVGDACCGAYIEVEEFWSAEDWAELRGKK